MSMKTPKLPKGGAKVKCACCDEWIHDSECEMVKTKRGKLMYFKCDHAREILAGERPWWDSKI